MKTRLSPLLAALALAVAGCVDNMGSVQIHALCSMPDTCTFSSTCDAQYIGETILDVALQDQLMLAIQVNNQRTPVAPVNTADAHVTSYVTEYSAPAGVTVPGTSGSVSSFVVPAGGSSVITVQPITSALGAALVAQVPASTFVDLIAHTRLKGDYDDQTSFETAQFDFAIRVCSGCLGLPAACTTGTLSTCGGVGQRPNAVSCK